MDGRPVRRAVAAALTGLLCAGAALADEAAGSDLDAIRRRLRVEAGTCDVSGRDADLPMVSVTVLEGDTHRRLSEELTGSGDAVAILKKIEPRLRPGERIYVPRALLSPRLGDPRLEALAVGQTFPTLWSLAREATVTQGLGTGAVVRNLQRLNGITDPTRLHRGARVLVPRSLLASVRIAAPEVRVRRDYAVTDLSGLERRPGPEEFPSELRLALQKQGLWRRQVEAREVDLVVLHTTEHRGAPFENVARYLQRKRLANYLIGPDGAAYEVVPEERRAFGCGQSLWEGRYAVDHEAINVEIYADTAPGEHLSNISDAQYQGLRALLAHIRARRPAVHEGRIVTHRMVALNYASKSRSRKGDPYEFDWIRAGLPDNSQVIDQDVLLGRAKMCTDERYTDRVTPGQSAASRLLRTL